VESEALFLCGEAFMQIRKLSGIVAEPKPRRGVFGRFSPTDRGAADRRSRAAALIYELSDVAHNLPEMVRLGVHTKQFAYFSQQTNKLAGALVEARSLARI
jgi:hypothetical protein